MYECQCCRVNISTLTDFTDFENLQPIIFSTSTPIRLFTTNDDITLEYNDTVKLIFTPDDLIPLLEDAGHFIRDTATVNIIDNDSE